MSIQRIRQYYADVERLIRFGGSRNELSVRAAFQNLLADYARQRNLELVPELAYRPPGRAQVNPDGTVMDPMRQPRGYWESKDEADDLPTEIDKKFGRGYPRNNILFEDGALAVLYQGGSEVGRAPVQDERALDALLNRFIDFEPPEIRAFREAIERFRADVPDLAAELRAIIEEQFTTNANFKREAEEFLELCREAINPSVELADVREMLIQHILTQDIFNKVFDMTHFHQENAIARELGGVVKSFYSGHMKMQIGARIGVYYEAINARAAAIADHHEKQRFLKVLYETFYKAYNPKGADRLGIVYTPNEIVRFMIESTETLLWRHFGRGLGDAGVEILDPATGTGTFVTELIDFLPPQQVAHKYRHDIHCNEVAILPYYIASLNIEYSYFQRTGKYEPFEHIVFVDTLDNLGGQRQSYPRQSSMFGLVDENAARIQNQNAREMTVIIGNPPYNANQLNENENNKNREYPEIDKRIKETYIRHSTAQKTKLYDMYARFLRWASDRLGNEGIIAFVSNSSFIDARTYDGFRKVVAEEFSDIYLIDMKGNARTSGERRRREGGNVFTDAIRVGVAVYFLVRRKNAEGPCRIHYTAIEDYATADDKLAFLATRRLESLEFRPIQPGKRHYWLNQPEHNWEELLPVISSSDDKALFAFSTPGISTNRDEWVYDLDQDALAARMRFFIARYARQLSKMPRISPGEVDSSLDYSIKWSASLKSKLLRGYQISYEDRLIVRVAYRPFYKLWFYGEYGLSDRLTSNHFELFSNSLHDDNRVIAVNTGNKTFNVLATDCPPDLHYNGDTQVLGLYRFNEFGNRTPNITEWALDQFRAEYADPTIDRRDIFNYVYAVLHNPAYRQKYELNLKRDFPRIPYYADFWQWAQWGARLVDLHIGYETADPYPLERHDRDPNAVRGAYKARLNSDHAAGSIELDTLTTLTGVPAAAWRYRLGNRCALDWVLDRYKERTPRDPTIRERFNSYRFRDYKEQVIDLLRRVTAVSVETMAIVDAMQAEDVVR